MRLSPREFLLFHRLEHEEEPMLVLTRRIGESILIGDDVEITLVRIEGDQVRIGISAPKHVQVYRKELLDEVQRENIRAAETVRQGNIASAGPETKHKVGRISPSSRLSAIKKSDKRINRTDDR